MLDRLERRRRARDTEGRTRFGVTLVPMTSISLAHGCHNMVLLGSDPVSLIRPEDRVEGDPTPGMIREQAVFTAGMWAGLVRTEPHMVSGWHHHGDYETSIFVISGVLRMESGPGGESLVEAGPGDFLFVPKGAIHREANPAATSRAGSSSCEPATDRQSLTWTAPAPDQPFLISSRDGHGSIR